MPEAFTEAFVAVVFFHSELSRKLPWDLLLKASVEENIHSFFSNLVFTSTKLP